GNASKSLKSPCVGMARSLRSEPPLYKTYPQETQMNHLNEGNDTPVKVRKHSESAGQNELPSSTSPAARVPSVRQVCKLIVSRMKCTEPSANRTLTPPGWKLRAAIWARSKALPSPRTQSRAR